MKKVKSLLIVLVAAALIMGAGYAAWTDNTTVTGTVGTGTMDVKVQFANVSAPASVGKTVSHDDDSVTFGFTNLYPTVYADHSKLDFQVKNEGSVPVMLDSVELIPTGDALLWDYLRTKIHVHAGTPSGVNGTTLSVTDNLMGSPNPLEGNLIDIDDILMAPPRNPNYKVLDGFVLQPGQAIRFGGEDEETNCIRIWLAENAPNETQELGVGFTLKFNWKQFNM